MPSGRLGAADLAAGVNTSLYTVPATKVATLSVCFCNRTSFPCYVRLAIASSASPTNSEWVMYDVQLAANGSIERTGLVLNAPLLAVVYASNAGVTATAYGFEE